MPKTRRFAGLLHVHAEIDQINQRLSMALRLVVGAHHTKREKRLAVLEDHGRDERMKGPFPRRNGIGMFGIEHKKRAPILQDDTGITGDQSRAKALKKTIDERNRVAILVDDGEINRIAIFDKARPRI